MNTVDTLMVFLFPVLDSLPFTLPRYWICRHKLRISFRCIVMLQIVVSVAYSASFAYINQGGYEAAAQWTTAIRYGFLLIFLLLSFLLIKDSFPKLMFTWLLFLAWQFFVLGNANFIESRFFWELSVQHPYLIYNIARVVIYLLTCPFMLRFFNHTVVDALKINDTTMWRHFWKVPLFPTVFGMLYCFTDDVYAYATWQFMVSRYLMLFGACYVSYVALKVLEVSRSRTQLEEALKYADRNLLMQKKQFDAMTANMDEIRKARHDLRQHLAAVQSYIERDDRTGLSEYIGLYQNRIPLDMCGRYCCNDAVNAIVSYYAALARNGGIAFEAGIDYPENCPVSSADITVLLGNLLENALEACWREMKDSMFIKLWVKRRGKSAMLILMDNTSLTAARFDNDILLSSKREGAGIGTVSVREIAHRYNGRAEFTQKDGVFYSSVYLDITAQEMV